MDLDQAFLLFCYYYVSWHSAGSYYKVWLLFLNIHSSQVFYVLYKQATLLSKLHPQTPRMDSHLAGVYNFGKHLF